MGNVKFQLPDALYYVSDILHSDIILSISLKKNKAVTNKRPLGISVKWKIATHLKTKQDIFLKFQHWKR